MNLQLSYCYFCCLYPYNDDCDANMICWLWRNDEMKWLSCEIDMWLVKWIWDREWAWIWNVGIIRSWIVDFHIVMNCWFRYSMNCWMRYDWLWSDDWVMFWRTLYWVGFYDMLKRTWCCLNMKFYMHDSMYTVWMH
jgi:hypothetical protein